MRCANEQSALTNRGGGVELLQLDKEMQRLPTISRREHKILYDEIRRYHVLDGPARQFLYPNDDFITTVTDRVHQYFEALVYGDGPIMSVSSHILSLPKRPRRRLLSSVGP